MVALHPGDDGEFTGLSEDRRNVLEFVRMYSFINADVLDDAELEMFFNMREEPGSKFKTCKSLEDVCKTFVNQRLTVVFNNVWMLYKIAATVAVISTASVERCFPSLLYIKNRLRNTMGWSLFL